MRGQIFGVLLLFSLVVCGQGKLSFESENHNFGTIAEQDGFAEHTFEFVNTGNRGVKISSVSASCGCTTPYWTQEEILPGDTGRITARYSTVNRPGPFSKSLTVLSNAENNQVSLIISGQVTPTPKSPKTEFRGKIGSLRFRFKSLNMGKISTEGVITRSFDVYNEGTEPLTFFPDSLTIPDHLAVRFVPETLAADEIGKISITYDPQKKNDLGYLADQITIMTDDADQPEKSISIIATLEEYFPKMTEKELEAEPKLVIEKRLYDFRSTNEGDTLITRFTLVNQGKKDLNIRKLKPNCECLSVTLSDETIAPSDSTELEVRMLTSKLSGTQYKNVSIFSNDPAAPSQMVTVKTVVKSD